MMSSSEKDLSRKDLNNILPSFMLNEVESIKSDNEEKKSKFSEEFNLLNSPFNNSEPKSKNGSAHPSSPNDSKSMECNKDSPKDESIETSQNYNINKFTQNNQNDIDDIYEAKTEFNSIINDANKNYGKNNLIKDINKYYSLSNLNFNCENFLNGVNINSNIEYLCHNNYNNKLYNSNFDDKYKRNYIFKNDNVLSNNNFNLNHVVQQNKYRIIPFIDNIVYNKVIFQKQNVNNDYVSNNKKNKFSMPNNSYMGNNINQNMYPEGNIINNYFNNINNFNIIENNFIDNTNYINNFTNFSNSIPKQNYFNQDTNIYNPLINGKNLDDFIKYINSLPMPLVNFLCTQKGTFEIQKKLEKSSIEYKVLLVNILGKQGLSKIMNNIYGNYFFQQLIKNKDKSFIELIISYISENLTEISKDFQGTFCIQALLDEISTFEDEQKILNSIKDSEMEMAFNKNATHVLQKIVLLFPDKHRLYLNEIILNNFIALCLDSNGICLIKIFIKTNTLVNNKKRINDKVTNNFIILAESPFGNYGVQYLMALLSTNLPNLLFIKLIKNLFSKHNFLKIFSLFSLVNISIAFSTTFDEYCCKDKNKIKKLLTKIKASKNIIHYASM